MKAALFSQKRKIEVIDLPDNLEFDSGAKPHVLVRGKGKNLEIFQLDGGYKGYGSQPFALIYRMVYVRRVL